MTHQPPNDNATNVFVLLFVSTTVLPIVPVVVCADVRAVHKSDAAMLVSIVSSGIRSP